MNTSSRRKRSNQQTVESAAAAVRRRWEEREQEGKRRAMEARGDIERRMKPVDRYQPTWAMRNMIRALEIMPWQNTIADWQRYYEAKYILRLRRSRGRKSSRRNPRTSRIPMGRDEAIRLLARAADEPSLQRAVTELFKKYEYSRHGDPEKYLLKELAGLKKEFDE